MAAMTASFFFILQRSWELPLATVKSDDVGVATTWYSSPQIIILCNGSGRGPRCEGEPGGKKYALLIRVFFFISFFLQQQLVKKSVEFPWFSPTSGPYPDPFEFLRFFCRMLKDIGECSLGLLRETSCHILRDLGTIIASVYALIAD
jgi:hypothetical protein